MRFSVVSHYGSGAIRRRLAQRGHTISTTPDYVITYGGDGTILEAERKYPGIPKIPVQKSTVCAQCTVYGVADLSTVLDAIEKNQIRIVEEPKIDVLFKGRRVTALNEIQLHIADPRRAIRFSLTTGARAFKEIIGDGLVVATPFGSTAYYQTIGYDPFRTGWRIGFNNVWPRLPFIPLERSATIKLLREPAWLLADNFFKTIVKPGDRLVIKPSREKARFVAPHAK